MFERIPPHMKQGYDDAKRSSTPDSRSPDRYHRRVPSFVSDSSRSSKGGQVDIPTAVNPNPSSPLYVVPSQFHEPLMCSNDDNLPHLVHKLQAQRREMKKPPQAIVYPDVFPVRKMLNLEGIREFEDDFEPLYSSTDHTLFLYPTSFEKFHHR